jgi:excisionase family DNA binding protein
VLLVPAGGDTVPAAQAPTASTLSTAKEWWTIAEIAAHLSVDKNVIYRAIAAGTGPRKIRAGKEYRVSNANLQEWLRSLEVD